MLKRFFAKVIAVLKITWVQALLVALFLILLIWILGPFVAIAGKEILSSLVARLIATLIVISCWGLFVAIHYSWARKKELADPEKAAKREATKKEKQKLKDGIGKIRAKVKEAIRIVTSANFYGPTGRSRYALPWYLVIGASNTGKTSMLLNSGLSFPLNEEADRHLYEIKETESCNFLYGNHAVFIDTPGKYTESRPETEEHKLWLTLLKHLFRVRPAKPLNGIIVCVSMRDIMGAGTEATRREHLAKVLRLRLSEILKNLHAYIPIYLVFTKSDAVKGFAQYFAHLSRAEREQIFGCPASGNAMQPEEIRAELKDLMQTLNAQIISKIHQERDLVSRGEMFRFPQDLAGLGPRLEDFIFEAFGPSRYHKPTMLRGFFFTSSLSVHDVLSSAAHSGELEFQSGFQPAQGDYAKGFFMLRLIMDCILPEAKLASMEREYKWGLRFKRHGLQLAALGIFLFSAIFLGISFTNNYNKIDDIRSDFSKFTKHQLEKPIVTNTQSALPELDLLVSASTRYSPGEDSSITHGLGLYRGRAFSRGTHEIYLQTLNQRLLPLVRAEAAKAVTASYGNLEDLKAALQAYLMLHQPERIEESFLMTRLQNIWSENYLGDAQTQASLNDHMLYLVRNGILAAEADEILVASARQELLKTPPAELAYKRIQEEAAKSGNLPYTFRAAMGGKLSPFTGDSYEVPYLYTREGFQEYCLNRSPAIIENLTDDSWVYGPNLMSLSLLDVQRIYKEVRGMYFRDYTRHWNEALNQLKVRKPASLAEAAKIAEQFTTGISPVSVILRDLKTHTDLVMSTELLEKAGSGAADLAAKKVGQKTGKIGKALAEAGADSLEAVQSANLAQMQKDAHAVKQNFAPMLSLLDENGNPTPFLLAAQDEMAQTGAYLQKLASSDNRDERAFQSLIAMASETDDTFRSFEIAAKRLPEPAQGWYLTTLNHDLSQVMLSASRYINKNYAERVLRAFNSDLRYYYPFNRRSDRDVNLDDFSAFFRPNGIFDNFYQSYLQHFINPRGELRPIMGKTLPFSTQAITRIQRAKDVQYAFFTSSGELSISFLMEPYSMDVNLKRVDITNGDKSLSYWHGPTRGMSITWPRSYDAPAQASIQTTNLEGYVSYTAAKGEWALFRIFQPAKVQRRVGNAYMLRVTQNDRWIDLQLQFRNKRNPMDPSIFAFVLPDSLF